MHAMHQSDVLVGGFAFGTSKRLKRSNLIYRKCLPSSNQHTLTYLCNSLIIFLYVVQYKESKVKPTSSNFQISHFIIFGSFYMYI